MIECADALWSHLVGSRLYEWRDQKKGLTPAGLLTELARKPL
jgi:hypothetical protein